MIDTGQGIAILNQITASGISGWINASGNATLAQITAFGVQPQAAPGQATLKQVTASGSGIIPGVTLVLSNTYAPWEPGFLMGGETSVFSTGGVVTQVVSSGGFSLGGEPGVNYQLITPAPITSVKTYGGFLLGGHGKYAYTTAQGILAVVAADISVGGFLFGGQSTVVSITDQQLVTSIVSTGGFIFGGAFSIPVLVGPGEYTTLVISNSGFLGAFCLSGGSAINVTVIQPPIIFVDRPLELQPAFRFAGRGTLTSILPPVDTIEACGGMLLGGYGLVSGAPIFNVTWVLTGFNMEPSVYSNYLFNSFAMLQDRAYGANDEGIFSLDGPDDAGSEIVPGLRMGPLNFGTDRFKRIRLIRPGGRRNGKMIAQVSANGGPASMVERVFEEEMGRIPVSREIEGVEFLIDLQGFESLDSLEVLPLVLFRK
jgi:hypothetical protein